MYSHFQKQPKYDLDKPSVRISSAYLGSEEEIYRREQNRSKLSNISKQHFRPHSSSGKALVQYELKNYDSRYQNTSSELITSFRPKVDKTKFVVNQSFKLL